MKIKISYKMNNELHFLRTVESATIETAEKYFSFSIIDKDVLKLPSKTNLIFEYQELIDAKGITTTERNNVNKRMFLFMKNCPNFKVVQLTHFRKGNQKELFQATYESGRIFINVTKSKKSYSKIVVFEISRLKVY